MNRLTGRIAGLSILFDLESSNGHRIELQLDTGFTGQIAADAPALTRLGFHGPVAQTSVEFGDGSMRDLLIYAGSLSWFGREWDVQAILTDSPDCTLGMGLLAEAVIHVDMPAGAAYLESDR